MRATNESKRKFEQLYREYGYESMSDFAQASGLNYANLSRVMNGKQGEGSILVRIAKFLGMPYTELRSRCGFCGVDGDEAIDELSKDFQGHHNTTVVGNSNNVMTNSFNADAEERYKDVLQDGIAAGDAISSGLIDLFSGVGGFGSPGAARKLSDIVMRVAKMEEDNKRKDERIRQLEGDKAFLQEMLKKR